MRDASGPTDGWAAIKAVSADEYSKLPAEQPFNPITSNDKVKRVFGIEMAHWESQLRAFLAQVAGVELNGRATAPRF